MPGRRGGKGKKRAVFYSLGEKGVKKIFDFLIWGREEYNGKRNLTKIRMYPHKRPSVEFEQSSKSLKTADVLLNSNRENESEKGKRGKAREMKEFNHD